MLRRNSRSGWFGIERVRNKFDVHVRERDLFLLKRRGWIRISRKLIESELCRCVFCGGGIRRRVNLLSVWCRLLNYLIGYLHPRQTAALTLKIPAVSENHPRVVASSRFLQFKNSTLSTATATTLTPFKMFPANSRTDEGLLFCGNNLKPAPEMCYLPSSRSQLYYL